MGQICDTSGTFVLAMILLHATGEERMLRVLTDVCLFERILPLGGLNTWDKETEDKRYVRCSLRPFPPCLVSVWLVFTLSV